MLMCKHRENPYTSVVLVTCLLHSHNRHYFSYCYSYFINRFRFSLLHCFKILYLKYFPDVPEFFNGHFVFVLLHIVFMYHAILYYHTLIDIL